MKIPYSLIKKYSLSTEDQDDIKSEIALSELQYGYQRKLDFIIIDYISKTRGYKRIGEGGKRVCVFKTEEYSETPDKSSIDDRALRISGAAALRNYDDSLREAQLDNTDNLEKLQVILSNVPHRTSEIMKAFFNGEALLEIGNQHGITESRCHQICNKAFSKLNLFFTLNLNPEIAKVVKW